MVNVGEHGWFPVSLEIMKCAAPIYMISHQNKMFELRLRVELC